jgi:cation:H+ antiporter
MIDYLLVLLGLVLLYKGADWLVDGASSLAKRFGVSSLVIGLTVVAFGTSMPELIVNVYAAIQGNSEVSFGNIIGSNIFNLLLILGLTGIITPILVQKSTVWKEIPFAMLAVLVLITLSNKSLLAGEPADILTRTDGIILLFFFLIFLFYLFESMRNGRIEQKKDKRSGLSIFLLIAAGAAALFAGGKFSVDGAVSIARQFGISELLISSTILAAGTSLPEAVTSIVAARKKEMDISVGNLVGSNIFNIFLIMGITATVAPLMVPAAIHADLLILAAATLLVFVFMFIGNRHRLDRWQAIVLFAMYISYTAFITIRG